MKAVLSPSEKNISLFECMESEKYFLIVFVLPFSSSYPLTFSLLFEMSRIPNSSGSRVMTAEVCAALRVLVENVKSVVRRGIFHLDCHYLTFS